MNPEPIVVIFGGRTGEHEVSLMSAAAILKHLDKELWKPVGIGIDYDGTWYLQNEGDLYRKNRMLSLRRDTDSIVSVVPGRGLAVRGRIIDCFCVVPVLHGTYGEDGTIQGLLEMAALPYAGSSILGSSLGMDKEMTKLVWQQEGLPVVPFLAAERDETETIGSKVETSFGFPVFVKPVRLGSSVGVSRANTRTELLQSLGTAFQYDTRVIIEPRIDGREIECAVVGNRNPKAYGPGEIKPSHDYYSYEAKYIDPEGAALIIPADLPETDRRAVRDLAVRAFKAVRAAGMSRVDFFYEHASSRILLNEINTIPGFTSISMFPLLCGHDGLSFRELMTEIINLGVERFSERRDLHYKHDQ